MKRIGLATPSGPLDREPQLARQASVVRIALHRDDLRADREGVWVRGKPLREGVWPELLERGIGGVGRLEHEPRAGRNVDGLGAAAQVLAERSRPGDLVITLGAGDITGVGPQVLDLLRPGGA